MKAHDPLGIRHSAVAGAWYPGTRDGLARAVDGYLANVDQALAGMGRGGEAPAAGELLGLISPHAGYSYSGQTAAYAYYQLQGRQVDTAVLVGPSHRAWLGQHSTSTEDAYETPLGLVALDRAFIDELSGRMSLGRFQGDKEHSLELQLPFLQRQLGEFLMVPILMRSDDPAAARSLAHTLAEVIRERTAEGQHVLLVASSDLHHIEDYEQVIHRDREVVDAIATYDLERLASLFAALDCSVCGRIPILTVMHAARALGAETAEILHHTNSGDVSGLRSRGQYTVGYVAAALYAPWPQPPAG